MYDSQKKREKNRDVKQMTGGKTEKVYRDSNRGWVPRLRRLTQLRNVFLTTPQLDDMRSERLLLATSLRFVQQKRLDEIIGSKEEVRETPKEGERQEVTSVPWGSWPKGE